MTEKKGKLVVLEGIDGAGTTSITSRLVHHFRSLGREVVPTYEPTNNPIGNLIKTELKEQIHKFTAETMATLFVADRLHHINTLIQPALDEDKIVICDRYLLSTLAYQTADGVNREWLRDLTRPILRPSVTILLDVDPEVAIGRITSRGEPSERFEKLEFLRRVSDWYDAYAKLADWPILRANANQDLEKLTSDVIRLLNTIPGL